MAFNKSESINELASALAKAQAEIKSAKKDSENPFFKSRYADLASVWDACREALTKNHLCVVQTTDSEDGKLFVLTTLAHSSGQWVSGKLQLFPKANDPQSLGSAISYARRYALSAMVGVVQEDDDAEAAMVRQAAQQPVRPQAAPKKATFSKQNAIKTDDVIEDIPF